jgi:hypothetical protein
MLEKKVYSRYHDILPGELKSDDIEAAQDFLNSQQPEWLTFWARQRRQTLTYNDQNFRTVIDTPLSGNRDKAVVFPGEFGTDDEYARLIAKARITRDMVDPDASLVIVPSSAILARNMNFSWAERKKLFVDGNFEPVVGRMATTLSGIGNPSEVIMFGPSQGGTLALECAASVHLPPMATAVYDVPSVTDRRLWQLMWDFSQAGGDLSGAVAANFNNPRLPLAETVLNDATSASAMVKFMLRSMHPDNIALVGGMCFEDAHDCIDGALAKGGSVVHSWGDSDKVSPDLYNKLLADEFSVRERYESRPLIGFGHAVPDFYVACGALARAAYNLKQT